MLHLAKGISLLLLVCFFWACSGSSDTLEPPKENGIITPETVITGLNKPWGMVFLDENTYLITEKPGDLLLIQDGQSTPLIHGLDVLQTNQGGLLDLELAPDFGQTGYVYMTYSKSVGALSTTALVRFRVSGTQLTDIEELFEAMPYHGGSAHYGSRMAFDNSGHVYVTLGDRYAYSSASDVADPYEVYPQQLDAHWGKVIRLNSDGSIPGDNPYVGQAGALEEIFSIGHRNPQGIAFDPQRNQVFANEHGAKGGDEANLIQSGNNYGWPVITYGKDYNDAAIGLGTELAGMVQPLLYWDPSVAPSSLLIYQGDKYPEWTGQWFMTTLANETLFRLAWDGSALTEEEQLYRGQHGRLRDVVESPDGYIYLLIDAENGSVIKLETE